MAGIAALAAAYVLSQFYRSFLAVLTPALTAEIGIDKSGLSAASGAYFLAFALAQFPVGVALDRFGPRRTAALVMAVGAGGGAVLFAAATEPWMIVAAMALIGLGCGPILMASLFIFAKSYSPARFAILSSWMVAFGTAGNVIGAAPLAEAAAAFGWRPVMTGLAVLTFLVATAVFATVRDPARAPGEGGGGGFSGYLALVRIKALWPIVPLVALNYAAAAGIRGLWAGPYLADVYGVDARAIGQVTLFMALAMVAGSFAYGPMDTLLGTRKWVAMAGNVVGLAALAWLAAFTVSSVPAVTGAFIVIGLFGGSYGLMMAHARAFVPAHLMGRGVTLMNFFSIGGVGAMQFATGAVVVAATVPGEPAAAYSWLFGFYVLALGLALLIYLAAKDAPPERL